MQILGAIFKFRQFSSIFFGAKFNKGKCKKTLETKQSNHHFLSTFLGRDPTNPARYHPFYITDSSEGGFGQKSDEQQSKQRVYAGVGYDSDGRPYPTAGQCSQQSN